MSQNLKKEPDELQPVADPLLLFSQWFKQANELSLEFANAMTLATVNEKGQPSARVVLLKDFGQEGFTFYSNYESDKAADLDFNPKASLLFFWQALQKQVRIEGIVDKVSPTISSEYFASRPRESQIGAHASFQSKPLNSREELEERYRILQKKFHGQTVPRPEYWGGYLLSPRAIEFWQGRKYRLHDRLLFIKSANGWQHKRLYP